MKNALSLILALVLCLSLCACGGGNSSPETEIPTEIPTETPTETPTQPVEDAYAEVRQALLGQWGLCVMDDHPTANVYEFREDGKGTWLNYKLYTYGKIEDAFTWPITFEITENKIVYEYPSASTGEPKQGEFSYTFDNGTLRLYRRYYDTTIEYFKDDNWLDVVIEGLRDDGLSAIEEEYAEYIYNG